MSVNANVNVSVSAQPKVPLSTRRALEEHSDTQRALRLSKSSLALGGHSKVTRALGHLKLDSHLPKKNIFICFNESPLKMMENAFYFVLKALFVLKKFKFLSRFFGHVGKRLN